MDKIGLLAGLFLLAGPVPAAVERPPNVVVILTDDQGYGDIGGGSGGLQTPRIDRMAAEGKRFTRWYAAQPVCSASRAGLLTGCYPNRVGIHGALGPGSRVGLNEAETTMAEMFRSRGYATAIYGKWHLGDHRRFLPLQHGFDEFFGIPYSNDMWPLHPEARKPFPPLPIFEGNDRVGYVGEEEQRQMNRRLTDRAVDFIHRNRDRPFFLYLPHPQPHVPLYTAKDIAGTSERGRYGDVIAEIDASVGAVLDAVDREGLGESTLVVFTSDNGPWLSYGSHGGSAAPLREGKGTVWEGGVRVPCVMRWTGTIPAGASSEHAAMHVDLLPTFAALAGADLPSLKIDGRDLRPLLLGQEVPAGPPRSFWFYYRQNELQSVMRGKWKLVLPHDYRSLEGRPGRDDGKPVPYSNRRTGVALFDLEADPGETRDLAGEQSEILAELLDEAEAARAELGDALTKRQGSGVREPGLLDKEELDELERFHWPEGRPPAPER